MNLLRKLISIIFIIFLSNCVKAQSTSDSLCTNISLFKDVSPIDSSSLALIDSANILNINTVLKQRRWIRYFSAGPKNIVPPALIPATLYLTFTLKDSSDANDTVYFYPGNSFRSITLYKILPPGSIKMLKDESKSNGFQPIILLPKERTSFIAVLRFTKRNFNLFYPQIIHKQYLTKFQQIFYTVTYDQLVVGYLLSGLLLMMIFFNAANFRLGRKKEYLYNCCYAICMFLLIFFNTYIQRRSGIFASFFMGYLAFALLTTGTVFYIAFTRKFLDTKNNYPLLNKIFYYEERVVLLLLIFFSYLYFFTNGFVFQSLLENGTKVILLAIGILYIIIGIKQKNKLINYLALGNSILIFFSILSFLLILLPVKRTGIFTSAILYYEIGIVCELIFFLLGLTYKNRVDLIEKIKEQEAMKLVAEKQVFETKIAVLNAQQEERNRISADMHDDLGAGVTAIRLLSELAKARLGDGAVPEIEKISSSANELLNNMNAIIWTMNGNNDSFQSMVAYIRSYAIEYFENTGIKCTIDIPSRLPDFPVQGEIRRNIFLVVKEALNNILKHAKATEVLLVLKKDTDGLSFYIHDNGTGIDLNNLRRFGNGLKNMRERMSKSGIDLSIQNSNGTIVILHKTISI